LQANAPNQRRSHLFGLTRQFRKSAAFGLLACCDRHFPFRAGTSKRSPPETSRNFSLRQIPEKTEPFHPTINNLGLITGTDPLKNSTFVWGAIALPPIPELNRVLSGNQIPVRTPPLRLCKLTAQISGGSSLSRCTSGFRPSAAFGLLARRDRPSLPKQELSGDRPPETSLNLSLQPTPCTNPNFASHRPQSGTVDGGRNLNEPNLGKWGAVALAWAKPVSHTHR
jgi:hypothetical protein